MPPYLVAGLLAATLQIATNNGPGARMAGTSPRGLLMGMSLHSASLCSLSLGLDLACGTKVDICVMSQCGQVSLEMSAFSAAYFHICNRSNQPVTQ